MSRLDPSVALIRNAVRATLTRSPVPAGLAGTRSPVPAGILESGLDGQLALVACSGGADSMALAGAAAFVGARSGWRIGLVTVDHRLQVGSGAQAAQVVRWAQSVGLTPAESVAVDVGRDGGPEAAARGARYRALAEAAKRHNASHVLLGHTEDDQAETVLLALARGAGPRGVAGMPVVREIDGVRFVRPLLSVSRAACRKACVAMNLSVWDDPHNADSSYARARVRADVMPALVGALGSDIVTNLARTASLIAADSTYLDELAAVALEGCVSHAGLDVAMLSALRTPLRTRVLHAWALSLGVPGGVLSHRHVDALDHLVTHWHGQGPVYLPGQLTISRLSGHLVAD